MPDSQYIPYGTVALMCTAALLHFCKNIRKYAPDTVSNRLFRASIIASAVYSMMEFCFILHEVGYITNLFFCYISEICYSVASLASAFLWFLSSEIEQDTRCVRNPGSVLFCSLPIILMSCMVLTTPLHHLVFYFTPDGAYQRSILNNVLVIITALYITKTGISALIRSFQHKYYLKRELYRTIFYYALFIAIAQLFQLFLGSVLPFRVIGATILFFMVQERTIKQNIFVDLVSGANNRTAMENFLKSNFDTADRHFAYAMIDLDDFKQINDQHGHSVGDQAIGIVSNAFKQALTDSHLFFARYGGDEFVLIGRTSSFSEIDQIVSSARNNIQRAIKQQSLPYRLEFSYGIAYKTSNIESIPELINQADAAMYENKKAHKAAAKA